MYFEGKAKDAIKDERRITQVLIKNDKTTKALLLFISIALY